MGYETKKSKEIQKQYYFVTNNSCNIIVLAAKIIFSHNLSFTHGNKNFFDIQYHLT